MSADDKLPQAVDALIQRLFKEVFKPLHKEVFTCSSRCCDTSATQDELQACVNKCQTKIGAAYQIQSAHLNRFQASLQNCLQVCQDEASSAQLAQAKEDKIQKDFDRCVNACSARSLDQLPVVDRALSADLKKL